ncbi:MAG: hypothetical protein HQK81_02415 [Desulfovibrionaceae bacterium]|nr:hypothetical protein [Desulfovibrionaceae bacterium]MBF0512899.1 hypothetical protein [Desulfovibrionaceae bacterium]
MAATGRRDGLNDSFWAGSLTIPPEGVECAYAIPAGPDRVFFQNLFPGGTIMKRLLLSTICFFVFHSVCQAEDSQYKYTKFDEFWQDSSAYVGGKVEISAFGRYNGGILFVTRGPGNAHFLHVDLHDLQENDKKFIQKSCAPHCNITVRGSVEKDRLGLVVIRGESVSVANY